MAQTITREQAEKIWAATEYPVVLSVPGMGIYKTLDVDPGAPDFDEPLPYEGTGGDDSMLYSAVDGTGWELVSGFTGQYGYNGPLMHESEYMGGGIVQYTIDTPGIYTVQYVAAWTDPDFEEYDYVGWVLLRYGPSAD